MRLVPCRPRTAEAEAGLPLTSRVSGVAKVRASDVAPSLTSRQSSAYRQASAPAATSKAGGGRWK
jgi:hypothetical protein